MGPRRLPGPAGEATPHLALLLGPPEATLGEDRGSGIRPLTGQVRSRDERPPAPEAEPRSPEAGRAVAGRLVHAYCSPPG